MDRNEVPPAHVCLADLRESLRRRIGDAQRALQNPKLSDEAIHSARKDLKRARAHLRLLRGAVGKPVYARENAALRDAARPLGAVRDAKVMLETVDQLLEREAGTARRALLAKIRGLLETARQSALENVQAAGGVDQSAQALQQAWERAARLRLPRKRKADLRGGVEAIYRRAREALVAVKSDCTPDNLHEWRKQVKYLGNAMDALGPNEGGRFGKLVERAAAVAESLGEHHDLVVLQDEVAKLHSHPSRARTGLFQELARRRLRLEAKALKQGRSLFRKNPKAFVKHLPLT